jgi:hypothetical protein
LESEHINVYTFSKEGSEPIVARFDVTDGAQASVVERNIAEGWTLDKVELNQIYGLVPDDWAKDHGPDVAPISPSAMEWLSREWKG